MQPPQIAIARQRLDKPMEYRVDRSKQMVYMPFLEDDETKALIGRLEQQRALLLEIMNECGSNYYEIGLIREHTGTDKTLLEAWLIPMFGVDEGHTISEFDRDLETDTGALRVHVVNWPDYWDSYIEDEIALEKEGPDPNLVLDWNKWSDFVRSDPVLSRSSHEEQLRAIRALGFGQIKISFRNRGNVGGDD
jgi:hypothetical protein